MTRQSVGRAALVAVIVAVIWAGTANGQSTGGVYTLSAATTDAGGGHTSGGALALDSSLAEPDAGAVASGGAYDLSSGFQEAAASPVIFGNGFE